MYLLNNKYVLTIFLRVEANFLSIDGLVAIFIECAVCITNDNMEDSSEM